MVPIPIDVLIVDDEIEFTEMLALRLQSRGHRVRTAASGEAALERLAEEPADVVVLDLVLPGLDGITTLGRIRALHPLVEVILLTGHGSVETAVEGLKAGACDYVLKPAALDDLLVKLEDARRRRAECAERIREAEERVLRRRTGDI